MYYPKCYSSNGQPPVTKIYPSQKSPSDFFVGRITVPEEIVYSDSTALPYHMLHMLGNGVFVGAFSSPSISGVACLLEDGTILVPLHLICDIKSAFTYGRDPKEMYYPDPKKASVTFVKGQDIYQYPINELIHDGTDVLALSPESLPSTFDYARLTVKGSPVSDLGGGLKLDTSNHFGSAFVSDPATTLAISGPQIYSDRLGNMHSKRYVSISENQAALSKYYMFPQVGSHHGGEGFSGQAVFPMAQHPDSDNTLYAIHSNWDQQRDERCGVKISEYVANIPLIESSTPRVSRSDDQLLERAPIDLPNVCWEGLRNRDKSDIKNFLDQLGTAIKQRLKFDENKIPPSLLPKGEKSHSKSAISNKKNVSRPQVGRGKDRSKVSRFTDDHQSEHYYNSAKWGGSYFFEIIGNNDDKLTLNALLNSVNKIVSQHFQDYRRSCTSKCSPKYWQQHPELEHELQRYAKESNFVVDLGFDVGVDKKTGKATSWVQLQGFGAQYYHIFPRDVNIPSQDKLTKLIASDYLRDG